MRINVIPDSVSYTLNGFEYEFIIVRQDDYYEEDEYKNDFYRTGCISWSNIYQHLELVFNDFADNNIHLDFLDNRIRDRRFVSFSKISKDGAFFENTFKLIYGDKIEHSSSTKKINDEIIQLLVAENENAKGKKKSTIKFLIKQLDHVTLSTKIQKALKDYKESCTFIRKRFNLEKETNTKIADTCSNSRNWVDHGDKKANIDAYVANCFVLLRATTYAMCLKRWGLTDVEIAILVNNLYSL